MACVVTVYDELNGTLPENRDDLAIKAVVDQLEVLFSSRIANPVLPDCDSLDGSWTPEERLNYKSCAAELRIKLDSVLNNTFHKNIAFSRLRECFGDRIPIDDLLIDIESEERKILAYSPATVAAPYVPRTTSG
jgi:hypothetical protein